MSVKESYGTVAAAADSSLYQPMLLVSNLRHCKGYENASSFVILNGNITSGLLTFDILSNTIVGWPQ